jgi:transposase-like protein
MKKHRKTWSKAEKLAALDLAETEGFATASRKLEISQTSLFKWRNAYQALGVQAFEPKNNTVNGFSDAELRRLAQENRMLKQLVADKELELLIHKELLKKSL